MPKIRQRVLDIRSFFLDSGAHSLYNLNARQKVKGTKRDYSFYKTEEFWSYVDSYAKFIKKRIRGIDYYANVDAIYNPEISWKVLKYLEEEHGLNPIPVIHNGTDLKWVERHIEAGYKYIGIGGLGQESHVSEYAEWADRVFDLFCNNADHLPTIKAHGFAMTSHRLLVRYPWFSVDSASWVRCAAYGGIFVPHMRQGKFIFLEKPPYQIFISDEALAPKKMTKHYRSCSPAEKAVIHKWLDLIEVPIGIDEWGVVSEHEARKVANIRFFREMERALPKWPWPFKSGRKKGGFFS